MESLTWDRHGELAVANARRNHAVLERGLSLAALRTEAMAKDALRSRLRETTL